MIIKNARYYDDSFHIATGDILIKNDEISEISDNAISDGMVIDASGCIVIPGLIDVHIHGCVGVDVSNGAPSTLSRMSKYLALNGITSYVPTVVTTDKMDLQIIAKSLNNVIPMNGCSRILGFRMEGPYLSSEKAGAHKKELLRNPDINEVNEINELSGNKLKIIDLAPELEGSEKFITEAVSQGYILSAAHSVADYDTVINAYKTGITDTTHLYNAMGEFSGRNPGIIGAAFDTDTGAFVEMICDGKHVHPANVRTAFKMVGEERLILISDGMTAMGCVDGNYKLGEMDVVVKDSIARTPDGKLAGSTTNLMSCLMHSVNMGIPFVSALKAATINPAKLLKIDKKYGSIAVNKKADMVIIDSDKKIKYVIIGGKVFNRGLI